MTPVPAATLLAVLASAAGRGDAPTDPGEIRTLVAGTITVAVTSASPSSPYDPQVWIRRYLERFAQEQGLRLSWLVVPFADSWLLASRGEVDIVATNVASFKERVQAGATFSSPFLFERRALRIRPKDRERFAHIGDFVGQTVGVVRGTAAERDVRRRAPEGVQIVATATFPEMYQEFEAGRLDAVAEAEYYALDGSVIPSHGPEVVLIDLHDLTPGQREESVFVVRDQSTNLLAVLNRFIARTRLPL